MATKAVFLDKDGTLIEDVPYNVDPQKIKFKPDAFTALNQLRQNGYRLFIVTNQSGVGLKIFSTAEFNAYMQIFLRHFVRKGIPIEGVYFCPHSPSEGCVCRKPKPGLILDAQKKHHLDIKNSWMVGDILADVEAGNSAGCRTLLVYPQELTFPREVPQISQPFAVVKNLTEVANHICRRDLTTFTHKTHGTLTNNRF